MTFTRISDIIVEITDDSGVKALVTVDEAKQLGYIELTYKGESYSYNQAAELVGRHVMTIYRLVQRYKYTTVEEIIEYYNRRIEQSYTYKNKPIKLKELESITGKSASTMSAIAVHYGFTTGEQIIEYYENQNKNKFTYKGEQISIAEFARIIGKDAANLRSMVNRNNIQTGEELIKYIEARENRLVEAANRKKEQDNSKKYLFTHNGKPISTNEVAEIVGTSADNIRAVAKTHGFTTAEEIIAYYENGLNKKLTYQGKHMHIGDFASLVGMSANVARKIAREYNCNTGEDILRIRQEFENKKDENKPLTYKGKRYTCKEFAELMNVDYSKVKYAVETYKYATGEDIIAYWETVKAQKVVFTYKGKEITIRKFAAKVAKSLGVSERAVRGVCERYKYSTGEQVIEHISSTKFRKRSQGNVKAVNNEFTYNGVKITRKEFAEQIAPVIGISITTIRQHISDNKFKTGEELIDFYRKRGYIS